MFCDSIPIASNEKFGIAKVDVNELEVNKGEVSVPATNNFYYTGEPQSYIVPEDGIYLLEVQGAQGGPTTPQTIRVNGVDYTFEGGYGGYSSGYVELKQGDQLQINVGGAGEGSGYNGGGPGSETSDYTKLTPNMTSDTTPSGIASASSSVSSDYAPWYAFCGTPGEDQQTQATNSPTDSWIQYEFPIPTVVNHLGITNRNEWNVRAVGTFVFQASNDGTNQIDLKNCTNSSGAAWATTEYDIDNNTPYSYYRLFTLSTWVEGDPYVGYADIRLCSISAYTNAGGGATHIALDSDNILSETPTQKVLIVAGGGGGVKSPDLYYNPGSYSLPTNEDVLHKSLPECTYQITHGQEATGADGGYYNYYEDLINENDRYLKHLCRTAPTATYDTSYPKDDLIIPATIFDVPRQQRDAFIVKLYDSTTHLDTGKKLRYQQYAEQDETEIYADAGGGELKIIYEDENGDPIAVLHDTQTTHSMLREDFLVKTNRYTNGHTENDFGIGACEVYDPLTNQTYFTTIYVGQMRYGSEIVDYWIMGTGISHNWFEDMGFDIPAVHAGYYTPDYLDICTGGNAGGIKGNDGTALYYGGIGTEYFNFSETEGEYHYLPVLKNQEFTDEIGQGVSPYNTFCFSIQNTYYSEYSDPACPSPKMSIPISIPTTTTNQIDDCIFELYSNVTGENTGDKLIQQHEVINVAVEPQSFLISTRIVLKDSNNNITVLMGGDNVRHSLGQYSHQHNLYISLIHDTIDNEETLSVVYLIRFSSNPLANAPKVSGSYGGVGISYNQFEENNYIPPVSHYTPPTTLVKAILGEGGDQYNGGQVYKPGTFGQGGFNQ